MANAKLIVSVDLVHDHGITIEQALAYQESLLQHISFVHDAAQIVEGIPPWQLEYHDNSKFSAEEFPFYARQFFGDKGDPDGWARAWLHHIHHNPHHWQHWMFPDGYQPQGSSVENGLVQMPERYVREMIADWMGASRAYTGSWDMSKWLTKNLPPIKLHSETKKLLFDILINHLGYKELSNG